MVIYEKHDNISSFSVPNFIDSENIHLRKMYRTKYFVNGHSGFTLLVWPSNENFNEVNFY